MTRRSAKIIGNDLKKWMTARSLTQQQLADAVNAGSSGRDKVSQSWISRICRGRFKRNSPQVQAILAHTGIPVSTGTVLDPAGRKVIDAAVDEVWDGSVQNARALARLLLSAKALVERAD